MAKVMGRFEQTLRLANGLKAEEKIALIKALSGEPLYTKAELDKGVEAAMAEFWADVERKMKTETGILRVK